MSRIGNKIIEFPQCVSLAVVCTTVTVKGPKGELKQDVHADMEVSINDGTVTVKRPSDSKSHKSLHGLYRSLISNMVEGVNTGFKKQLELVGVGFKAALQGKDVLELSLGYSHQIYFAVPSEISVSAETPKGKAPIVTIEGIDKQLVGQVAAKLKSLRKVEPYKGKGVRFVGEQIRRKAGKTAAK